MAKIDKDAVLAYHKGGKVAVSLPKPLKKIGRAHV